MNTIDTTNATVENQRTSSGSQQAIKTQVTSQPPEGAIMQGAVEQRANVSDRNNAEKSLGLVDIDLSNFHEELEAVVSDVNQNPQGFERAFLGWKAELDTELGQLAFEV